MIFSFLDSPGSEESPPLAGRLSDDVERTGWFVRLPVLGLTLPGAVGHLPAHATLELLLLLGDNFTEVAGSHLLVTL